MCRYWQCLPDGQQTTAPAPAPQPAPQPAPVPSSGDDLSPIAGGLSGQAVTTRYWDCCKPSCAWPGKAPVSAPVQTCSISDAPLSDPNAASGCSGGSAFTCSGQQPWAVSDSLAYGGWLHADV